MTESQEKRAYHSPRRQEQAKATRWKILEAAHKLFVANGYVAATLPLIAREAGVSAQTVTAIFGTKLGLLDALIKAFVRGDDAQEPVVERTWWQDMLREPDPHKQLQLFAAITRGVHGRSTDIFEIVRGAAAVESEIAAVRKRLGESRLEDVRGVAESLAEKEALAPEITTEQAADVLWAAGSAEIYRMLVVDRGWTADRYEKWLASTLTNSLLG